jgi:hypothetical protein
LERLKRFRAGLGCLSATVLFEHPPVLLVPHFLDTFPARRAFYHNERRCITTTISKVASTMRFILQAKDDCRADTE